jgi:hypothetical protein
MGKGLDPWLELALVQSLAVKSVLELVEESAPMMGKV